MEGGSGGSFFPPIGLSAFETQFLNFAARHPKARGGSTEGLTEAEAAALVSAYYAHGSLHPDDVEGFRQIVRSAIGLYVCKPHADIEKMLKEGTSYVGMFSTPVVGISHVLKLASEFRADVARKNIAAVKQSLTTTSGVNDDSPQQGGEKAAGGGESGWQQACRRSFEHLAGEGSETASLGRVEQFVVGMLHGWQVPQASLKRFLSRTAAQIPKSATFAEFVEYVIEPLRFLMGEAAGRTAAMVDPSEGQTHRQSSTRSVTSLHKGSAVAGGLRTGRKAGGFASQQTANNLFHSIDKISERQEDLSMLHESVLVSPRTMDAYCRTTCVLQNLYHLKPLNYRRLQRFCDRMVRHGTTGNRRRFPGRVVACVLVAAALCSKHRDCARCEWLASNNRIATGRKSPLPTAVTNPSENERKEKRPRRPPQPTSDDMHCTFKPHVCPYPPSRGSPRTPRVVVNESLLVLNISRALKLREKEAQKKVVPAASLGPLDFGLRRYGDDT